AAITGAYSITVPVGDALSDGTYTPSITVTDTAGNATTSSGTAFTVDTTPPAVPTLAESSTTKLSDGYLNNTEASTNTTIRVSFTKTGNTAPDVGGKVELLLNNTSFSTAKTATLTAAHITNGYVDFTVAKADLGIDGSKSLTAVVTDKAGNASTASTAKSFTLDTAAPTLSTVTAPSTSLGTIAGTPGNSAGETITLTLTFDGAVNGLTSVTNSNIFKVAGNDVSATWGGTAGSTTRTLTYTVAAGQNGLATIDEAALKTALIAGISDAAGNAFSYTGAISDIDAGTKALPTIDTTAPTVSSIAFTSATGIQNKLLNKGDTVTVTVTMSEAVNVDVNVNGELPVVYLNIGDQFPKATYDPKTSTSTLLRFVYTIEDKLNGDPLKDPLNDDNGIGIGPSQLFLGTIKDAAGNDANRDHAFVSHDANYKVDTTAPVFTNTNWSPNIPSGTPDGTTILTATATDANGVTYSLSGTDAIYFNIADTGVVTLKAAPSYSTKASYSFKVDATDLAGNVTSQDATLTITPGPGDATIVLPPGSGFGTNAQLVKPIQVDGGRWYYLLDTDGNGVENTVTHDVLDNVLNGALDTTLDDGTRLYRFGDLTAKLATIGVTGLEKVTDAHYGTSIGAERTGDNTINDDYNDLLAIWDAYNGKARDQQSMQFNANYWPSSDYWAADLASAGKHYYMTQSGVVNVGADNSGRYAVFEVVL
nr:Ig-like domain-containing protein [Rhodoferax sp.]